MRGTRGGILVDAGERIGLIAGNGRFPIIFAENAKRLGYAISAVAHIGETEPELERYVERQQVERREPDDLHVCRNKRLHGRPESDERRADAIRQQRRPRCQIDLRTAGQHRARLPD